MKAFITSAGATAPQTRSPIDRSRELAWRMALIVLGRGLIVAAALATAVPGDVTLAADPPGKSTLTYRPKMRRLDYDQTGAIQQVSNVEPAKVEAATDSAAGKEQVSAVKGIAERQWTLDSLQILALEHNPTLTQVAAAIDADHGLYDQVGRYPNPQVGYLRSDNSRGDQSQTQGIFLSQEFVTAGKLHKNRAIEASDIQRLSWDAEAQRMRVLNDLKIRYFELLGAQRAVALAHDLDRIASEGYELAGRLNRAQQASRKDVIQAKVQMSTVRLNLREAEYRLESAWGQLTLLIGVPEMERAKVTGSLEDEVAELGWEDCWAQLVNNSPQLHAAVSRVEFARNELARESVEPIPNLNVQIVAERDRVTNSNTLSTLFSVPVPIFNRNRGNIQRAQAEIRQANAEVERVRLVLRDLLTDAFRRYKTARIQVSSLRDRILPDAKETLELTTAGYKQGEFGILEVLSARQTYFASSLAYVEALTDLQKVTTEINGLQLTGGLNPAEIGAAIQGAGGSVSRQRAVLNNLQETSSKRLLPAAVQTGG